MQRHLERAALVASVALFVAGLAAMAWLALVSDPSGTEPELIYEASRIRRGLALFADPVAGTLDDGPVRVRHVQLYTPFWTWLLSRLPDEAAAPFGRLLSVGAWFGSIGAVVASAPRDRREGVAIVGLSYASLFLVARAAGTAAADTVAAVLVCAGLWLTLARGRLTFAAVALAAAGALLTPQVLGVPAGLALADLAIRRKASLRELAFFAGLGAASVALLQLGSGGQWLAHLRMTTQNAMNPLRWTGYLADYALLLGVPHLVVAGLSLRASRASGAPPYGAVVLAVTVAWNAFSMGKHGSATNYWLEPTLAMIVVLGRGPTITLPTLGRPRLLGIATALGAAALPIVFAIMGASFVRRESRHVGLEAARVAWVREACPLGPGETLLSSDPTLELQVTGKIAFPAWALAFAARKGTLPLSALADPLESPATRCFVDGRRLETPFVLDDPASEAPIWDVELRDTILSRYAYFGERHGAFVYRRK